ncbi:ABC-type Fe3+/spermidine/putrescine transport system ATPase subunit [Paenibacillus aceris]|uniref:ABC-type Fe3+/spermidine/putrescine transport system ATPase subunit n=1 Tax=Paenibacillus aceris TaxID=869555 RepID=A0ABS4I9L9_9BACL|nr:ABC-type Fe3+/spermidine/putrescine transport system ATPase subunit [Paenibacillus aceris]
MLFFALIIRAMDDISLDITQGELLLLLGLLALESQR